MKSFEPVQADIDPSNIFAKIEFDSYVTISAFFHFEFLARVLRPGRPIPPDLRNYATQIPDMGASTCAVVDFESTDSGKIDDLICDPL